MVEVLSSLSQFLLVLGCGVPVHFVPFQAQPTVRLSAEPVEGVVTSSNRFVSDKDGGGMVYVIHLA